MGGLFNNLAKMLKKKLGKRTEGLLHRAPTQNGLFRNSSVGRAADC